MAIYEKPRANIILNRKKLEPFPWQLEWDRAVCILYPIQYNFIIPSQSNKTRAKNKRDSNKEGRYQSIPICRWHDPIPKLPQKLYQKSRNHKLSKVAGYKINIQKSLGFLYSNIAQTEKEIREAILFTIVSKTIKYLGINLTKETKDLFNENYKPQKREIK
jgi:hypothetical protein